MLTWFIPNSGGDYTLKPHPDGPERSLLIVENATPVEITRLDAFVHACRDGRKRNSSGGRGWLAKGDNPDWSTGRHELVIDAPVSKAGPVLAGAAAPVRGTLTVVTSVDGQVMVTADDSEGGAEAPAVAEAAEDPKAKAAVTTRRGTVCCPVPVEGPLRRASRVLRHFCTPRQWRTWCERGWLECIGGTTGRLYRVHHRHHPVAVEAGMAIVDMDAIDAGVRLRRAIIHRWDYTCPAPEEVLGAMHWLQHREGALRNRSGAYTHRADLLGNRHGHEVMDGRFDAAVFESFGLGMQMAAGDPQAIRDYAWLVGAVAAQA